MTTQDPRNSSRTRGQQPPIPNSTSSSGSSLAPSAAATASARTAAGLPPISSQVRFSETGATAGTAGVSSSSTNSNSGAATPRTATSASPTTTTAPAAAVPPMAADWRSDAATAAFIRRTLCAHHGGLDKGRSTPRPLEELLPPLTSSNDVDLQLYAIIAVVVREFVLSWYGKITTDHVFVDSVVQVIAHCTRALEQRLRNVDMEALLLDEIPALFDAHITVV
ncbi:PXA domain-containing protein [Lineolata rhizophorae]|uniref:PXA domain-containing protein n=1 Tax=Lineolata rhizophorae TaxID=578093 RepID=A0A6A6NVU1_9PEZI|nr:PXA domain-containing protein [Lineolata rhizophorae]